MTDAAYWTLPALADYYLEDSWVLDVTARPGALVLRLDFVLLESHRAFTAPLPGEQYCYRSGVLRFPNVRRLTWSDQGRPPARDATGEIDYGSVDTLLIGDDRHSLVGDFGNIEVSSAAPVVELDDERR
ncbi:hypothetical protein [Cellulomonas massiliensis]|uniref:hypothetical protein n=1 Tax=Cellulomonas massiliensis TaxID=1465811 RepID=UPI0003782931|nr:hypothetical protein [Cellulomonas massiliensis]